MYVIFTYMLQKFLVNVGKYTSPMDPMGYIFNIPELCFLGVEKWIGGITSTKARCRTFRALAVVCCDALRLGR